MERAIADLHAQMLASSELIKALADQNAQLVERLEVGRKRASWLVAAAALSGVVALVALAVAWFGR
jgi:negative regulator of sigma E activity